jgi:hypothetical protein
MRVLRSAICSLFVARLRLSAAFYCAAAASVRFSASFSWDERHVPYATIAAPKTPTRPPKATSVCHSIRRCTLALHDRISRRSGGSTGWSARRSMRREIRIRRSGYRALQGRPRPTFAKRGRRSGRRRGPRSRLSRTPCAPGRLEESRPRHRRLRCARSVRMRSALARTQGRYASTGVGVTLPETLWEQGAVGSNPLTPTILHRRPPSGVDTWDSNPIRTGVCTTCSSSWWGSSSPPSSSS